MSLNYACSQNVRTKCIKIIRLSKYIISYKQEVVGMDMRRFYSMEIQNAILKYHHFEVFYSQSASPE